MNKQKTTKRKRDTSNDRSDVLDEQHREAIKAAAKSVSDAKQSYKKAYRKALQSLAKQVGYGNIEYAAEGIMEDVEQKVYDDTADEWEKHLTAHVRHDLLLWKKSEIDKEIEELKSSVQSL